MCDRFTIAEADTNASGRIKRARPIIVPIPYSEEVPSELYPTRDTHEVSFLFQSPIARRVLPRVALKNSQKPQIVCDNHSNTMRSSRFPACFNVKHKILSNLPPILTCF